VFLTGVTVEDSTARDTVTPCMRSPMTTTSGLPGLDLCRLEGLSAET
jgi:hypothetical protein